MMNFSLFLFLGFSCVFFADCELFYENSDIIYRKVCNEEKEIQKTYVTCFETILSKEALDLFKDATDTTSMLEAINKLCDDRVIVAKVSDLMSEKNDQMRFDGKGDGMKLLECLLNKD